MTLVPGADMSILSILALALARVEKNLNEYAVDKLACGLLSLSGMMTELDFERLCALAFRCSVLPILARITRLQKRMQEQRP